MRRSTCPGARGERTRGSVGWTAGLGEEAGQVGRVPGGWDQRHEAPPARLRAALLVIGVGSDGFERRVDDALLRRQRRGGGAQNNCGERIQRRLQDGLRVRMGLDGFHLRR